MPETHMVTEHYMRLTGWFIACSVCAVLSCDLDERTPTSGLVIIPSATGATSTMGVATEIHEYRIRASEADDAIRLISDSLVKKGWRPIERLWDDQNGTRGSYLAGWRCAIFNGRVVRMWVNDWRDSMGNIVTYVLREPLSTSDSVVVRVNAVDASVANATHIAEVTAQQPVVARGSCAELERLAVQK